MSITLLKNTTPLEKILIENFKAIEKADIEIKNLTVFIGEQASGKSTIAKLVYFFKTLPDQILYLIVNELPNQQGILNQAIFAKQFNEVILQHFSKLFGHTRNLDTFEITYSYPTNNRLTINNNNENKGFYLRNTLANTFFQKTQIFLESIKVLQQQRANPSLSNYALYKNEEERIIRPLRTYVENYFWGQNNAKHIMLIPASRNMTVGMSDMLSSIVGEISNKVKTKTESFASIYYSQNLYLLNEFLTYSSYLVNIFRNTNGFSEVAQNENFTDNTLLQSFIIKVEKVLKGKYSVDDNGEKLSFANRKPEYFNNASSGQQEVIRLFQDLFVLLVQKINGFRVYEEPEAHLFPAAQQKIVETIAMLINHNPAHQFLITTHSPYFIAAIDVLLEANEAYQQRAEGKNIAQKQAIENEIAALVPKSEWLDFEKVIVYSLEQNPETGKYIAKTAMRENRGVKAEIIDKVSEDIDNTYSQLLDIHYHEDGNE
jgi:predicted ATPase